MVGALKLVLASSSSRRVKVLKNLGLNPIVIAPKGVEEVLEGPAEEVVRRNATAKLRAVLEEVRAVTEGVSSKVVVVAADTIVVTREGRVLGKASNIEEARKYLKALRCGRHSVLTGVAVALIESGSLRDEVVDVVETRVKMRCFSDEELEAYLRSGEPLGKAGAYALQGLGALLVERVDGDPYNVVGLPLARVNELVVDVAGVSLLEEVTRAGEG